jgi:hypothetical protein
VPIGVILLVPIGVILMVDINVIIVVVIGGYSINDYWWLFY